MKELKLGFAEQLKDKGIIKQSLFIWLKHEFVLLFFHAYIDTHHCLLIKIIYIMETCQFQQVVLTIKLFLLLSSFCSIVRIPNNETRIYKLQGSSAPKLITLSILNSTSKFVCFIANALNPVCIVEVLK